MPVGVRAEHYVSSADYLVANTIGMGASAPAIREAAAHAIDGALAVMNSLPVEQREQLGRDLSSVRRDVDNLIRDVAIPTNASPGTPGAAQGVGDLVKFSEDLRALSRDGTPPPPPTPGKNELARDGVQNTPNGPIHSVPVYLDIPQLRDGDVKDWVIEQHDLPGMLASRHVHLEKTSTIAGSLDPATKTAVDRAIPEFAANGVRLPPARSIDPWDGKPEKGTIFKVDETTYGMHTGRGAYVTLDVGKDLGGVTSPSNTFVELAARGHGGIQQSRSGNAHGVER